MNLGDARTELAARGFDYLSANRMTLMLNNAKNAFEDSWPFPWLWETLIGPAPLTVADLKYVFMVKHVASDCELLGLSFRQIAQEGTDIDLRGVPEYWWLEGPNIVHTWPVNTDPIEVFYIRESPELVNVIDEPLIPARYHPVWLDLAVVQAYKDSDNFAAAGQLSADVNGRLGQLIERYETTNRQNGHYITHRWPPAEDD